MIVPPHSWQGVAEKVTGVAEKVDKIRAMIDEIKIEIKADVSEKVKIETELINTKLDEILKEKNELTEKLLKIISLIMLVVTKVAEQESKLTIMDRETKNILYSILRITKIKDDLDEPKSVKPFI